MVCSPADVLAHQGFRVAESGQKQTLQGAVRMQTLTGKIPNIVASCAVLGGLPLLAFIVLFLQLTAARNAGHPLTGDAIGLAMMSVFSYGLALLSFGIGAMYFGYKRVRYHLFPKRWHLMALAWGAVEVAAPVLYFAFF
jgi:hypothetical protein